MADRLGYTTGDCKRGLYVNIAWYIGYSLINTPFLFGERFATPRPASPEPIHPHALLDSRLLLSPRERRDRNLLFLNFCATPRVGKTLLSLWKFLAKLFAYFFANNILTRKFQKVILIRYERQVGKDGNDIDQPRAFIALDERPLRLREFPFDRVFPCRRKGSPRDLPDFLARPPLLIIALNSTINVHRRTVYFENGKRRTNDKNGKDKNSREKKNFLSRSTIVIIVWWRLENLSEISYASGVASSSRPPKSLEVDNPWTWYSRRIRRYPIEFSVWFTGLGVEAGRDWRWFDRDLFSHE